MRRGAKAETNGGSLGGRIRSARLAAGLSQADLAGKDFTKGFISQVELGISRPSLESLQVLASRLGHDAEYFMRGDPALAPRRLAVHLAAAEAAHASKDWAALERHVRAAETESPDTRTRVKLERLKADRALAEARAEDAVQFAERGLVLVAGSPDEVDEAHLLYAKARASIMLDDLASALPMLEDLHDRLERSEIADPMLRASVFVSLGTTYRRLNRGNKALAMFEAALGTATKSARLDVAGRAQYGIGGTLADAGESEAAIGAYRRALRFFERAEEEELERRVLHNLSLEYFKSGHVREAGELAERLLARATSLGDESAAGKALVTLSRVALQGGDVARAITTAEEARSRLAALRNRVEEAEALLVLGAARHSAGDHAGSDTAYRSAIEMLDPIYRANYARACAEYADRLHERGRTDEAYRYLRLAHARATE